jgi:hypothetical protein
MTKLFLKIFAIMTGASASLGILWGAFTFANKVINPPLTEKTVQEIVNKGIEPLVQALSDHNKFTKTQEADFSVLETSYIDELKLINRLDAIIKYHENKEKAEKQAAEDEKKKESQYPQSLMIPYRQIQSEALYCLR